MFARPISNSEFPLRSVPHLLTSLQMELDKDTRQIPIPENLFQVTRDLSLSSSFCSSLDSSWGMPNRIVPKLLLKPPWRETNLIPYLSHIPWCWHHHPLADFLLRELRKTNIIWYHQNLQFACTVSVCSLPVAFRTRCSWRRRRVAKCIRLGCWVIIRQLWCTRNVSKFVSGNGNKQPNILCIHMNGWHVADYSHWSTLVAGKRWVDFMDFMLI